MTAKQSLLRAISLTEEERYVYDEIKETGLLIGVVVDPPYAFPCFEAKDPEDCPHPGMGIELTAAICQILAIPCTFQRENR